MEKSIDNKMNGVTITKSLSGRWSFDKAFGNMVLVNADDGGVQVVINDDLSSLDAFYITVQGQEV